MTAPTTRATPKIALDQRATSRHDNADSFPAREFRRQGRDAHSTSNDPASPIGVNVAGDAPPGVSAAESQSGRSSRGGLFGSAIRWASLTISCRSRGSIILRQSKSSIRCTALLRHPRTTRMPSTAVYGDSGMGNSMIVGRFKHEEAFFRRRRLQEDPTEFSRRRTVRRAGRPVPLRTDPHGPRRAPQSTRDDRRPRSKPPPPASAKGDISTLLKGDISTLP
jgi:hypothetical protein